MTEEPRPLVSEGGIVLPSHMSSFEPEFADRLARVFAEFGEFMARTATAIVAVSEAMQSAIARIFGVEPGSLDARSLSWSRIRRKAGIPGKHGRRSTSRERKRRRTQALQHRLQHRRRFDAVTEELRLPLPVTRPPPPE